MTPRRTNKAPTPLGAFARVFPVEGAGDNERPDRELAVARHLAGKGTLVVRPTNELPAGPHLYQEFAVRWNRVRNGF